jgi:hypothetical protein
VSAAVFNDFFLNKVEKLKASIDTSGLDPLEPARRQAGKLGIKLHSFTLKTVQAKQVLKSIKRSKKSACPDIDGISPDMLKIVAPLIAVPLAWVINPLICCQKVPSTWKRARIIPLHKKKEKNMASNYRPVSILPTCSKVMEDVVRAQISQYCHTMVIIPFMWIRSYLTGRLQLVEYGGQKSEMRPVTVGSPQGSILSPLLFLILTSDMPEVVTEGTIVTYADDTTVYVMHKDREAVYTGLEKAGDKILLYMKSNALAANSEKNKFILFSRKKAQSIRVGQSFVEESKA